MPNCFKSAAVIVVLALPGGHRRGSTAEGPPQRVRSPILHEKTLHALSISAPPGHQYSESILARLQRLE